MNNSEYLVHHGVVGMRWGHRKDRVKSKRAKKSNKRKSKTLTERKKSSYVKSEDAKEVKNLRKKPVGALSNAELRKINQRLNLEREYRNLRQDELNRGKKDFEQVLSYADTANRTMATVNRTMTNVNTLKELMK